MPQRHTPGGRRIGRLVLFSLLAWALVALGRAPRTTRAAAAELPAEPVGAAPVQPVASARRRVGRSPRRLAASFSLAVLFFAGASFSAVAGDRAVSLLGEEGEVAEVDQSDAAALTETEAAPAEAPVPAGPEAEASPEAEAPVPVEPAEPVLPEAPAAPAVEELAPASQGHAAAVEHSASEAEPAPAVVEAAKDPAPAPEPEVAHSHGSAPTAAATDAADNVSRPAAPARPAQAAPTRRPQTTAPAPRRAPLDPEASAPGVDATVWLHRALPDPTPPSLRLSPEYASRLVRLSRQEGADWALVLGVLRADTSRPQAPARPVTIAETADRLVDLGSRRNAWSAALALTGRTATSDRAVALARYYRAIGVDALVRGLRAEQERLVGGLLADERVQIYGGGRTDLLAGRVDVRVAALISYLAEAHGQVTVSSLVSGHRLYARPGVVSAHVYGAAVDIAALGGTSILGHQEPGSVTERAVRDILLLPAEMRPRQLISLIGMGGPSFALANHHDHIHVGF
jgi:hypothetical protein